MNSGLLLKALGIGVIVAAVPLVFFGCKNNSATNEEVKWPDKPGPKVVVSFAPLYCFAANVAGDDAAVKNVMTSKGPHDFDPTADDIRLVTQADIFFTIGMGLDEKQAETMRDGSGNKNLKLVKLGNMIDKKHLCESKCRHADHGPDHKHEKDPHLWLSPDHAVMLVNFIRDELKAKDPARAVGYDTRAAAYVAKLQALSTHGTDKFKDKKDRRLVSFHDSLAYFEQAFDLDVREVLTKNPGQEPDATEMKKLIETCSNARLPVRIIATEPQYSTSSSGDALRKELVFKGVKDPVLVEFDPLETVRPEDLTLDWYERKMRENIDKLAEKMK